MARIRTIKPEFWLDEKLAPLAPIDRLVFLGLISQADDAGRLIDNLRLLDGLLFSATEDSSRESLDILQGLDRIIRYRSPSGQPLIQIAMWDRHQKVHKPSAYVLPAPPLTQNGAISPGESAEKDGDSRENPAESPRPDPLSPLPRSPLPRSPTTAVANATGADAPPVESNGVGEWLGRLMPVLRECGFEADDTDGSILKHWHKRALATADDVEAAIRGTALLRIKGKLKAFEGCKLSLRLLYARPKPNRPPELRPLWNEAIELYHRELEQSTRGRKPLAGSPVGEVLQSMLRT